jgi:nucleotide-binding universal stress UspA family protein
MTAATPRETVLVAVDGSAASAAAVRWAAAEAERRHARLHAVHVIESQAPPGRHSPNDISRELDLARRTVPGRVGGWMLGAGIAVDVAVSVVTGDVGARLAREAADAELVVIGAPDSLHHSALPRALAETCLCPVAMVGPFGDVAYVDVPTHSGRTGASPARR